MSVSPWTESDSERAEEIWEEYRLQHVDVLQRSGQTAGIDPVTGQVWIGESIQDVIAQRDADGSTAPLYFVRIGSSTYFRKGGRR